MENRKFKTISFVKNSKMILLAMDWFLFIIFCILAIYFMKNVLEEYHEKKTGLAQSLEPITTLPTVVFCIDSPYPWEYKKHLTISYQGKGINLGNNLDEHVNHVSESGKEIVQVVQIENKCFKVTPTISEEFPKGGFRRILLKLKQRNTMPESVKVYFTSETNSYGSFTKQWWEGRVFELTAKVGKWIRVSLQSSKYQYLDDEGGCSYASNFEQWIKTVSEVNFTDCPKKCSTIHTLSHVLPMCGWTMDDSEARICADPVLRKHYLKFLEGYGYKRPCNVLEFDGKQTAESGAPDEKWIIIHMEFAPPMMTAVYQEYFIFDTVGLIGSAGGTLGMCVGFSFTGFAQHIINYIQAKLNDKS